MALSEEDHKLIDDILLDNLSEQKSLEAKKRAEDDTEFSQELQSRLSMVKTLQDQNTEIKADFKRMLSLSKHKSGTNHLPFIKVAATLLILVVISLLIWQLTPTKGEKLFTLFYTQFPEPKILRGNQTDIELNDAFTAYSNHEYEIALDKFLNLTDDSLELNLYIGNCYLQLNMLKEAERIFKSNNSEHYKWYLAFTYLKMNRYDESSALFFELVDNSTLYKEKSATILKELR